jgi:hypothetical protein
MFVGRRSDGSIYGTWTCLPPGDIDHPNVEELPDDHPEVLAFRDRLPIPPSLLTPPSREAIEASHRKYQSNERELRELDAVVLHHMKLWSELETALSTLFYEILHTEPRSSLIPYVIYYSPEGFDAREKIVDKTLRQFLRENPKSSAIEPHWDRIHDELNKAREMRNKIAHGAPLILGIRGKNYVRHSPPAFDVNRVGNLIPTGTIPGVSVEEISRANKKIIKLVECVDAINRAIAAFSQDGADTLLRTLPPLEASLTALTSP